MTSRPTAADWAVEIDEGRYEWDKQRGVWVQQWSRDPRYIGHCRECREWYQGFVYDGVPRICLQCLGRRKYPRPAAPPVIDYRTRWRLKACSFCGGDLYWQAAVTEEYMQGIWKCLRCARPEGYSPRCEKRRKPDHYGLDGTDTAYEPTQGHICLSLLAHYARWTPATELRGFPTVLTQPVVWGRRPYAWWH